MASVLTVKAVEKLKPGCKRREVPDGALPGLYLVIQPSGQKSFAVRTRVNGRPAKYTLAARGLREARDEARAVLAGARQGKTPRQAKADREAQRPLSFAELADAYMERWAKPRKRTWKENERDINRDLRPIWGSRTAAEITRRDVVEIIDRKAHKAPIRANRLRALLVKLFGWAVDVELLAVSPAAGVKPPSKERSRDRVLDDDELAAFWRATATLGHPFGPFLRVLALTAQRKGEVAHMLWRDLLLASAEPLWSLAAASTKAGRAHDVPLAPAVVELLSPEETQGAVSTTGGFPRIGSAGLVFTTTGDTAISGFSKVKRRLDGLMLAELRRAAEERGDDPKVAELAQWRLHDLRRTAASTMARLGFPPHVVAAVLNHSPGATQGITAVYNRYRYGDEKRRALEAWAGHLASLIVPAATNVLPLRA